MHGNNVKSRSASMAVMLIGLNLFFATLGVAGEIDSLPGWTLQGADGKSINFYRDSAERPTVLLFWATWCPYCRRLMPRLEKVRQEFATEVNFYALNIWENGDPAAYLADNGYGFHLLLEADEVAETYGIKGTPGLFVVDTNQRVIYVRRSGTKPDQVESDLRFALSHIAK